MPRSRVCALPPFFLARATLGLMLAPFVAVSAQQANAGSSTTQPTYAIRTRTNLVVEDVTVTGVDGRPVRGLKAGDFTLAEDGHPEQIRNFSEHMADAVSN